MRTLNNARRGRGMRRVARLAVRVRRGGASTGLGVGCPRTGSSHRSVPPIHKSWGRSVGRPLVLNSPTNWESATKISNVSSQIIKHRSDTQRGRAPTFAINPDFAVASCVPPLRGPAPSPTLRKPSATRPCLPR